MSRFYTDWKSVIDGSKRSINVDNKPNLPVDRLCSVLEHSSCKTTTLELTSCELKDEEIIGISKSLIVNETVSCLDLRYNQIGRKGIEALAQMFRRNKTLTKVNLSCVFNRFQAPNFKPVIDALNEQDLVQLNLWVNLRIRPHDATEIQNYIKQILQLAKENRSLKQLYWNKSQAHEKTKQLVETPRKKPKSQSNSTLLLETMD